MDSFEKLMEFVRSQASSAGFNASVVGKVALAAEEALVNVINYAYGGGEGDLELQADTSAPGTLQLKLIDSGAPFDPLQKEDPDITAPAEQRPIGGLGIFMVKQIMDSVTYERIGERNVLTMVKQAPAS